MTIRTTQSTVTFRRPFILAGLDEEQPAGIYDIETDEERLEGLSFSAYRRVQTLIHLHPKTGNPSLTQTIRIDPDALDVALQRDRTPAQTMVIADGRQNTAEEAEEASQKDADREAMERGEDEGMIVRQQRQWTRGASTKSGRQHPGSQHVDPDQ
ncbi:MAG: hypothetical protein OEU92_34070 [Alphaproteobacteria bacterium]|nr:hypothetical protein [Alphaproteobacteria bacterium]